MILEGHADYATPGDLEALDEGLLQDIAEICEVIEMAPDECIPCLALSIVLDRQRAAADASIQETLAAIDAEDEAIPDDEEGEFQPKLANTLSAVPPWTGSDIGPDDTSVADQFASKVAELSLLVEELLEGPPIPPPGVTLEDLALLTLAADKWVKMSEIQGGLAPQQQQMLDATRDLVTRLRS